MKRSKASTNECCKEDKVDTSPQIEIDVDDYD